MPSETIRDTVGLFDATVRWTPDGDLQLGIEVVGGKDPDSRASLLNTLYGPNSGALVAIAHRVAAVMDDHSTRLRVGSTPLAAQAEVGQLILDAIATCAESQLYPRGYIGVWSTLDRPGANRLVRALRRARNQVFGADE